MASSGVYMYPYNQQVTLGNFNMPFSSSKLTVYRGANNPLSFTVHNADGKYMLLADNEVLTFSIFDAREGIKIFEQDLEKQVASWVSEAGGARPTIKNKEKVYYGTVVPAGVLQDITPGSNYRWSIRKITKNGDIFEPVQYMYTGLNYEASAELVVSTSAAPMFVPSVEISKESYASFTEINDQWRETISTDWQGEYSVQISTPIRADSQYGMVDGLSTIAMYFKDFEGRIKLQGCLSNDVPKDTENQKWFDISIDGSEYISTSEPLNGIQAWNFHGNYMWFRVQILIVPEYIEYAPATVKRVTDPLKSVPKILIRS